MSIGTVLRSGRAAWLLGAAVLAGLSALAYAVVGWLGIGILGLAGLLISTNLSLQGGHALADGDLGGGGVPLLARQIEEARKSQASPEQKMAAAAERSRRARTLYLVNTVFIAMTALGFGLFLHHQLHLF